VCEHPNSANTRVKMSVAPVALNEIILINLRIVVFLSGLDETFNPFFHLKIRIVGTDRFN
jgi:hypothetical protein